MSYQYKREPLNDDETTRIFNACETLKEKLIVWVLLDTGMRVSELANLTKQNIQWQERRIVVYGKGGPYGKQSKRRIVPMTDRVRKLMENHFTFQDKLDNCSVRNIQRIVKIVANRAGISKPVTPHILRHTFAVNAIKKGISTRALMTFLGHDRLATTEIYLNLSPEDAIREFQNKW
jgi:integrase/recombinase XerD